MKYASENLDFDALLVVVQGLIISIQETQREIKQLKQRMNELECKEQ